MDTRTHKGPQTDPAKEAIRQITDYMPGVHQAIKDKAGEIGGRAYELVRRGARGEVGCFFAFERGRVVGTPFGAVVDPEVAQLMVQFGATYLCMWPAPNAAEPEQHCENNGQ